jgi:hypothetical protein
MTWFAGLALETTKPPLLQGFPDAPREIRTPTPFTLDKALNLAARVIAVSEPLLYRHSSPERDDPDGSGGAFVVTVLSAVAAERLSPSTQRCAVRAREGWLVSPERVCLSRDDGRPVARWSRHR